MLVGWEMCGCGARRGCWWWRRWQGTSGDSSWLALQALIQRVFAERFEVRGILRNNLKSKGSSYANSQQLAAQRKWLTLCSLFPMQHLCVPSLREGERGTFSNCVCKQTLLIAFLSLLAAWREKKTMKTKQRGLSQSASLHVGRKMLFPWGNGPSSNWREECSVGWVMTKALGAHHLSCRVNKEVQTPSGWESCLTCCSHPSHTWGIHTLYKLWVLKLCRDKTPPHSTSSPSAGLE